MTTATIPCAFEHEGPAPTAVAVAPQSLDLGVTITWQPVCSFHASTWWDDSDWGPIDLRMI